MSDFRFDAIGDDRHRPWAVPAHPWLMRQTWTNLMFAHWRVPAARLRRLVPPDLTLDLFDGSAWIGVVPFQMSNVSVRGLPNLPHLSAFPELNVRTYVIRDGKPGVFFFSLDAARLAAVLSARVLVGLPYHWATMSCARNDDRVAFRSGRRGPSGHPSLTVSYRPTSTMFTATPGTREYFLVERYCLYTLWARRLRRLEIQHPPWSLRTAEAAWRMNTMLAPLGLANLDPPVLHCVDRQDMVAWAPETC